MIIKNVMPYCNIKTIDGDSVNYYRLNVIINAIHDSPSVTLDHEYTYEYKYIVHTPDIDNIEFLEGFDGKKIELDIEYHGKYCTVVLSSNDRRILYMAVRNEIKHIDIEYKSIGLTPLKTDQLNDSHRMENIFYSEDELIETLPSEIDDTTEQTSISCLLNYYLLDRYCELLKSVTTYQANATMNLFIHSVARKGADNIKKSHDVTITVYKIERDGEKDVHNKQEEIKEHVMPYEMKVIPIPTVRIRRNTYLIIHETFT